MAATFISGIAFGAALAAAGVYQPTVIISQMKLENCHMLETFLVAAGVSLILVTLFIRLGYLSHQPPRPFSPLNLLGGSGGSNRHLDGNVLGGLIQGAGMTLCGACPGTVFVQLAVGIPSAPHALLGAVIGGLLWSGGLRQAAQARRRQMRSSSSSSSSPSLTLDRQLGVSRPIAILLVELVIASAVFAISHLGLSTSTTTRTTSSRALVVDPLRGGLMIAGAQLVSVLTRRTLLGTSSAFEEVGDCAWWLLGFGGERRRSRTHGTVLLVLGMVTGAYGVAARYPGAFRVDSQSSSSFFFWTTSRSAWMRGAEDPKHAVVGGVMLAVGARMAGGCTSGHGISGVSLLSVSSFVTVAAMFAGGIGMAVCLD
ncbi:hypothetical protein F4778DRAFT_210621 [Xylariomycetidae sp. FL2044]|nr:hypothetical protein F4778DRAFT_210621 [Xylariomycetidae sp. FL2044]